MYVLAGLPPETHSWAVGYLQTILPHAMVVGAPSATQPGHLYPDRYIEVLTLAAASFAFRRRTRSNGNLVTPQSITLFYIPAPDDERLLRRFDFAVLAHPLSTLIAFDVSGRQLRQEQAAIGTALEEAVSIAGDMKKARDHIQKRVAARSEREPLLLPPVNFWINDARLESLFLEYRRGHRSYLDRFPELRLADLTRDDLPRLDHRETRHAFVDDRYIAFLNAHPTAYDGSVREVDHDNVQGLISVLRSLYRFGVPLPQGFHHDAQRADGTDMNNVRFDCERDGPVHITASHANIYPNDFVRAKHKTKI